MEKDGIIIEELWDVAGSLQVCMGDWDARVRPGWDIRMHARATLETHCLDNSSDSDGSENISGQWVEEILDQYQEEWCLPRWRAKVEQQESMSIVMQEPSYLMLALGCVLMVFFTVAIVVYTA
ncbi:hypothetical protein C7974DRAFT_388280 [Boeremia exigua]|uniref:uncharacterized protein n=1 Tax=Boeremia exigua TaxID=749465 RepID=UPI001E8CDF78|nr:uncharacterized protein C7974DRAFT_388280 [Boeremia exigua]KAH6639342.1 hypothetical protein C7974DRAFT_388280 [Boeremia exigua]